MKRSHLRLVAIAVFIVLLLGSKVIMAEEDAQPKPAELPAQQSPTPIEQEASEGFSDEQEGDRPVGTPVDPEQDLDASFPQPGSVLKWAMPPEWFQFKKDLYEKYGLKVGLSYQMLYQKASDNFKEDDSAWGQYALFEAKWELLNRDRDFMGSLVWSFDWRETIGDNAQAFNFHLDTGSLWPTDFVHLDWGPWVAQFFWEQWLKKDVFVTRLGNQFSSSVYDNFRFKDGRTSFTAAPYTLPVSSIPTGPPGLAANFEWWPIEDSEFYVVGTVNDLNAKGGEWVWDRPFEYGQFFYGLEVGHFWRRTKDDFDHFHLNVFYADERDTKPPVRMIESEAGWGFKLLGEKQLGRLVGFGSYTYNTAKGGGFGTAIARHAVTAGAVFLNPLGVAGELALGGVWADPIPDDLREQYGLNAYWKILLTPDLWLTPGVQFIFDPSFNEDKDQLTIGQIKFRFLF